MIQAEIVTMNAFKMGISTALALSAIIILCVISSTSATSSNPADIKTSDADMEIENSIIIHGLRMESGKIIELPEFGKDFSSIEEPNQTNQSVKNEVIYDSEETITGKKYL